MSHQNENDTDDEDDSPETYLEHRRAKARADLHDDHDRPRDSAADFDGVGEGGGIEDVLEGDGDGDVSKSTQAELEDALGSVDFLGAEPVEKGESDDQIDLSWSDEDFNPPTEADLLAQIRDELAEDREAALKSLTTDARHDAVAALERAEKLEGLLESYVDAAPANGLEDSLAEVVAWLREQAEGMEDAEERRRVTDALGRLPDTGGASA